MSEIPPGNVLSAEDVKLWLGELFIENKLLQRELIRLKEQLEQIKIGLSESSPKAEKGKGDRGN